MSETNQKLAKCNVKKVTDELPSSPLTSAYSSVVVNLNSGVQQETPEVKTKTLRTRVVVNKKTTPLTPKPNQTKQRRSRNTQVKPGNFLYEHFMLRTFLLFIIFVFILYKIYIICVEQCYMDI